MLVQPGMNISDAVAVGSSEERRQSNSGSALQAESKAKSRKDSNGGSHIGAMGGGSQASDDADKAGARKSELSHHLLCLPMECLFGFPPIFAYPNGFRSVFLMIAVNRKGRQERARGWQEERKADVTVTEHLAEGIPAIEVVDGGNQVDGHAHGGREGGEKCMYGTGGKEGVLKQPKGAFPSPA